MKNSKKSIEKIVKNLVPAGKIFVPAGVFFGANLAMFTIFRIALGLWQSERMAAGTDYWRGLLVGGLRIDLVLLCWTILPFIVIATIVSAFPQKIQKIWQKIQRILLVAGTLIFLFMELATPAFIATYDVRPNRIFVEYLIYPREVFSMLFSGHWLEIFAVLVIFVPAIWGIWKLAGTLEKFAGTLEKTQKENQETRVKETIFAFPQALIFAVPAIFLCIFGGRGHISFGQHPISSQHVVFADDNLLNSLALNSTYSLVKSIGMMTNEIDAQKIYGKMSPSEIISTIRADRGRPESDYISAKFPTLTRNKSSVPAARPRNVVIILEESLGARYIGCLGGADLSPNFDKLAREGWNFANLYCTGTRSVRGIEATTTGFTPTAAQAVVKLPKAQSGFFTLADFFGARGYKTQFVYGGHATFDNMNNFCLGNGYQEIVDRADFSPEELSVPEEVWGVSDVDSLAKLHRELEKNHATGTPFFTLYFSVSNHDPFVVPAMPGLVYKDKNPTRENSVQYADYALGHFFELAKNSAYWDDTIFLVVADHDSRVEGPTLVPVDHYHVPALIFAPGISPRWDERLVSQIDLPPTLISLAGLDGDYPMIGYDLTKNVNPNRALLQFFENFAYMRGNALGGDASARRHESAGTETRGNGNLQTANLTILANSKTLAGTYNFSSRELKILPTVPAASDIALARATVLLGTYLYQNELFPSTERMSESETENED